MITTEEAIKTLKENCCAMCAYGSQDMDFCDIRGCDNRDAIKALEQEPCDDCISRQAVIDMTGLSEWFDSSDSYNEFVIALSELPPVTPQPKTGYWISWYEIIEEEWGTEHNPHCKCSECSTEVDPHTSKFINCCPVCGAKMVGYKKRVESED